MYAVVFEYHTFLHHSQTYMHWWKFRASLNTIHFYIILKQRIGVEKELYCLNTIHFYIILKPLSQLERISDCLNTIHFYIILKLLTLIRSMQTLFEYHTFLHHSQTSNPKMKCLIRTYSTVFKPYESINFTTIFVNYIVFFIF